VQHPRARVGVGALHIRRVDTSHNICKFSLHKRLVFYFPYSSEMCGLHSVCLGQILAASGRRRACTTSELRAEWAQLEMQLGVAQVAAAAAVAIEASTQTTLEPAK
jgi:hypothetical protein